MQQFGNATSYSWKDLCNHFHWCQWQWTQKGRFFPPQIMVGTHSGYANIQGVIKSKAVSLKSLRKVSRKGLQSRLLQLKVHKDVKMVYSQHSEAAMVRFYFPLHSNTHNKSFFHCGSSNMWKIALVSLPSRAIRHTHREDHSNNQTDINNPSVCPLLAVYATGQQLACFNGLYTDTRVQNIF